MSDDEISSAFQDKLERNLDKFQSDLEITSRSWDHNLQEFSKSMQQSIDENSAYYEPDKLRNLFEEKKNYCVNQVGIFTIIFFYLLHYKQGKAKY